MKKLLLLLALWPSLAIAQASSVNLSWNAVTTYVGGGTITGTVTYNMYRGLQSNGSDLAKISTSPITTTTYTDSTLTVTTQYYFAVTAVSPTGVESAKSNILGVRLSDFIPNAPANLRVVMAIP